MLIHVVMAYFGSLSETLCLIFFIPPNVIERGTQCYQSWGADDDFGFRTQII